MRFALLFATIAVWPGTSLADVAISNVWARASVLASRPAAAYLTLTSDREDQLVGIASPVAGRITVHAIETDTAGVSRMVAVEALNLPPGEPVTLAPGGMHLMLTELSGKLEEGTFLLLTLTFASGARMEVNVPVLGPGASGPQGN